MVSALKSMVIANVVKAVLENAACPVVVDADGDQAKQLQQISQMKEKGCGRG